jgi:hypothetical protein
VYIIDVYQGVREIKTMGLILTSANGSSGNKVAKYIEAVHPEMKMSTGIAMRIANDMMDKTERKQLSPLGKREFAQIIEEVLSENTYINEWPYKVR